MDNFMIFNIDGIFIILKTFLEQHTYHLFWKCKKIYKKVGENMNNIIMKWKILNTFSSDFID
jgi:hypothetical protein